MAIFIATLFDPNSTFALEFNCSRPSFELLISDNEIVQTSRSNYIKKAASHFAKWLVKCILSPDLVASNWKTGTRHQLNWFPAIDYSIIWYSIMFCSCTS